MSHLLNLSWYRCCGIRNKETRGGEIESKDTCTLFIAAYLPLSFTTTIPIAESDTSVSDHDSESSLGESLGTKTLQEKSVVPASLRDPQSATA
jgi:hypothetical protein